MLLEQLKIEYLVYLRQPIYLLFSVIMPVLIFALFGSMLGGYETGGVSYFDQYVPAFATLVLFASAVYNIGNQVVTDKVRGVYRRLLVTPVPFWRFMLVLILKAATTAIVGFGLVLGVAAIAFDVAVPNPATFTAGFLIALLYALMFGFGAGVIFDRLNTYAAVMMFTFMPMFFLSDAAWPVSQLPEWLGSIAEFNPLYHLVKLMRWMWSPSPEAWTDQSLWVSLAFTLGLLALFLPLVYARWRKSSR
ncbi:ABC transporter permease [Microbacterium aurugineum]